jgi:hypothetical protein
MHLQVRPARPHPEAAGILPVFSTSGAPSTISRARLSPGVQSEVTRIAAVVERSRSSLRDRRRYAPRGRSALQADDPVAAHARSWLSIRPDTRVRRISATRCIAAAAAATRRRSSSESVTPSKPLGIFLGDEGRGDLARDEAGVVHHRRQERQVVADPFHLETVERHAHRLDRRRPGPAPQVQSLAIIGS